MSECGIFIFIAEDFTSCCHKRLSPKINFIALSPLFFSLKSHYFCCLICRPESDPDACLRQVVVVQAISALCQKYPRKHSVMMNFLSNMLRDDVSFCPPPKHKATGTNACLKLCYLKCIIIFYFKVLLAHFLSSVMLFPVCDTCRLPAGWV